MLARLHVTSRTHDEASLINPIIIANISLLMPLEERSTNTIRYIENAHCNDVPFACNIVCDTSY